MNKSEDEKSMSTQAKIVIVIIVAVTAVIIWAIATGNFNSPY